MTKFGVSGLGLAPEPPKFPHQLPSALLWAKVWDTEGKWQCQGPWEISSSRTYILQNLCPPVSYQISSRSSQYLSFGPIRIGQELILSALTLDSSSCVPRMAPSTSGLPLEFHKICQSLFSGHMKETWGKVLPLSYHQAFILRLKERQRNLWGNEAVKGFVPSLVVIFRQRIWQIDCKLCVVWL